MMNNHNSNQINSTGSYLQSLNSYKVSALKKGYPHRWTRPAATFAEMQSFALVLQSLGHTDIFVDNEDTGHTYKMDFTTLTRIVYNK